jgi:hypothetical protein
MRDFPDFMKHPANRSAAADQSQGVEGYVFDGADGSQLVFWRCSINGDSQEQRPVPAKPRRSGRDRSLRSPASRATEAAR